MVSDLAATLLISIIPVSIILILFFTFKKRGANKDMLFLLGFLSITMFYIFAPDPEVVQALYVSKGDYSSPFFYALASSVFLVAAVFIFKIYRKRNS